MAFFKISCFEPQSRCVGLAKSAPRGLALPREADGVASMAGRNRNDIAKAAANAALRSVPALRASFREMMVAVRFAVLWMAACALVFQSTLALVQTSAAVGLSDGLSLSEICSPTGNSDPTAPPDQTVKKCPQCILCIPGFNVLPSEANEPLPPLSAKNRVLAAYERQATATDRLHDHPPARGPPAVA